jgi:DinB superfamily
MADSPDRTILAIIERETPRLQLLQPSDAAARAAPGKWSRKEILGHLIDSASNNHQRFVRAALSDELAFPGYSQSDWVRVQGYADEEWQGIIDMWAALNRHIAHIVSRLPAAKLRTPCRIGDGEPVTLEALIADYIRHMEHHLEQVMQGFPQESRG